VVWQALDRFERALAIDPNFAPAHAALAGVYGTLGAWEFGVLPPAEAVVKAKAAAKRALESDPQLAAGHTAIAYTTLHFNWNADKACQQFDLERMHGLTSESASATTKRRSGRTGSSCSRRPAAEDRAASQVYLTGFETSSMLGSWVLSGV
jgi:hypothetical protein